jgi:hypothetical protein
MNTSKDQTKILLDIGKKKVEIEEEILKIERHIYDLETRYLEMTQNTGNIIKGWEQIFVPKPKVHCTSAPSNYRRLKLTMSERIFSQTSYSNPLLKDDSTGDQEYNGISLLRVDSNFLRRKKKLHCLSLKKKKKKDDESFKLSEKDSLDE